jgi:pimeloyl-ACP methyl ester carboxylesterase
MLALVAACILAVTPGARAGETFDTADVQAQLDQIQARAAQIKPAAPTDAAPTIAPPPPSDAPVDFKFNPEDVKGKDAVVLSVCGLSFGEIGIGEFQLDTILWYFHRLFPDKKIDAQTLRKIVKAVDAVTPRSVKLGVSPLGDADNYLESTLREQFSAAKKNYLVVPLPWTRNSQKSDAAIADFKAWMAQVYDAAQKNGKPVYVVCHSWGTLLTFETLESLSQEGSPIRVEKLVTLGSPLVPSQWWVKLFVKLEEHFQGLQENVVKPANVKVWFNFWAQRDPFSNSIPVADGGNVRVDAAADSLAQMITRALFSPVLAIEDLAAKDWFALHSIGSWHGSYMWGYHQNFPSIGQKADIEVFGPDILPKL